MADNKSARVIQAKIELNRREPIVKEIFQRGERDLGIEREMASPRCRELLQEISRLGYPIVKIGKSRSWLALRFSQPGGAFIQIESRDEGASLETALQEILLALRKGGKPQQ